MTFKQLLRNNVRLLSIAVVLSLATTAVTLLQPGLVGALLSGIGSGAFVRPLGLLLLVLVASALLSGATMYVTAVAADRAVRDMRKKLTRKLLALRVEEYEKVGSGGYTTRVASDTSIVSTAFSSALVDAVGGFTIVVGAIVYMAVLDLRLLGLVVAVLLVSLLVVLITSSLIGKLSQSVQDHLSKLGEIFQSALSAIRTIKSFRGEKEVLRLLDNEVENAYRNRRKMSGVEALLAPLSTLTAYSAILVVLLFGSMRMSSGELSGETLAIFVTALFLILAPIVQVSQSFGAFFEAKGALARINDLFLLETEDVPVVGGATPTIHQVEPPASIELESVIYRRGEQTVLENASVLIAPGEKVALTGPSGAGKTTIFSLILRFYDSSSGRVLVGGIDVRDWDLSELRRTVTYVEQEPDLLPGTLRDNLLLGVTDAPSDIQLIELLEDFGLGAFAAGDGLERKVGSDSSGLSGGERQRVAIIRAMLQKAGAILVDEPTSALDTMAGEAAMAILLGTESTVIFSSHDPVTIDKADRVLAVSDLQIHDSGDVYRG